MCYVHNQWYDISWPLFIWNISEEILMKCRADNQKGFIPKKGVYTTGKYYCNMLTTNQIQRRNTNYGYGFLRILDLETIIRIRSE